MPRPERCGWLGAIAIGFAAASTSCIGTEYVACGDRACPLDTVCTPGGCVAPDLAAACVDLAEGAPCTTTAIPAGTCIGGACRPAACGDGAVTQGEICDDGNTLSADGCAADCQSNEVCGNQITDGAVGEQCDSGIPGLAGDGCSSSCLGEVNLWLDVGVGAGPSFEAPALAVDPLRGVIAFGGRAQDLVGIGGTWRWTGTTWLRLQPATEPPRRANGGMVLDRDRQRAVLFGGRTELDELLGDTWEWDGLTWIPRTPAFSPPPRAYAMLTYDRARQRVVLFGGVDMAGAPLDDTWEWDGTSWTPRTPATSPPPIAVGSFAYDVVHAQGVLVTSVLGPTWLWTGTTWMPAATQPTIGQLVTDDTTGGVRLLGNDGSVWTWTGAAWNAETHATAMSVAFFLHSSVYDPVRHVVVVVGDAFDSEVHELAAEWTVVIPPLHPSLGAQLAYDARRGRVVAIDLYQGTWEWDGSSWELRVNVFATPKLTQGALAYDSARGVTVYYGEESATSQVGTFTWDGTTWRRMPGASPPSRLDAAMAFDAARGQVLLFGGSTRTEGLTDETWLWDGTAWTQRHINAPPARSRFRMAYDPITRRIILFGGVSSTLLDDTWSWDGTTWAELHPPHHPSRRTDHGVAFDPGVGRIVVSGRVGDLWELVDHDWVARTLAIPTPGGGDLVQDVTGGLVLGDGPARLGYRAQVDLPDRCLAADADTDHDGRAGCTDPDCWERCTPLCPPNVPCPADAPRCGDGQCAQPLEDRLICPADCDQ